MHRWSTQRINLLRRLPACWARRSRPLGLLSIAGRKPYAHYGRSLAQWQLRLDHFDGADSHAIIEMRPHAYDAQKATRITPFHALLSSVLGRVWQAANRTDTEFAALMVRLGLALGKSRHLDGRQTDWSQQFWAMVWERGGGTIFE